jgi:hypothetical protein
MQKFGLASVARTLAVGLATRELNCGKACTVRSEGGVVRVRMPGEAVFTLAGTLEK